MKNQTTHWMLAAILIICSVMTSCKKETTNPENETIKLQCEKPNYLVVGDTVALISPSYYTPMENVERTAEVLRGWGLTPIIGPNVGKIYQGKYAGTVEERVSDLRWALNRLTAYNIPVMCGFPAGHDDINLPLVMGAPVTMDVRADGATLQFDIEGQQTEVHTSNLSTAKTPLESRLQRSGKTTF